MINMYSTCFLHVLALVHDGLRHIVGAVSHHPDHPTHQLPERVAQTHVVRDVPDTVDLYMFIIDTII